MARPVGRTQGYTGQDAGVEVGAGAITFGFSGAPVNGTSGTGAGFAGKGSLLLRTDNGTLYQNTNTTASPTWTLNDVN